MNSILTSAAAPIEMETDNLLAFADFEERFHQWIHSSKQSVIGLPGEHYIVSGITDAFNQTYGIYNKIGLFSGEYGYHQLVKPERVTYNLSEADVIILSHPFSADGMDSNEKLQMADTYNKPIFVDCAFFGICHDINFDFSQYKNIHSVCFSLSKTFGTGRHRVGLLYTRDNYPVSVYKEWQYPLLSSAEYHYNLINKHSPDSMVLKYKSRQLRRCSELGIQPSNTIIFGLDYTERFSAFKRGPVNRVCISKLLKNV